MEIERTEQLFVNRVDTHISEAISSDRDADFIWVSNVDTKKLAPVSCYYSPSEGSSALFLHSDGINVFVKGRPYSIVSLSNKIKSFNGYYIRPEEPVILAACKATKGDDGSIAQKLSNLISRPVIATPGYIHVTLSPQRTTLKSLYSDASFIRLDPKAR